MPRYVLVVGKQDPASPLGAAMKESEIPFHAMTDKAAGRKAPRFAKRHDGVVLRLYKLTEIPFETKIK